MTTHEDYMKLARHVAPDWTDEELSSHTPEQIIDWGLQMAQAVKPSREDIDEWLVKHCGVGIPFKDATDNASMLHGLAYILRQIEGTNKYMVNIGQTGPATSALRMALDYFAVESITRKADHHG